jgi:tetratricopeptide (TPR) repeat protein
MNPSNTWSADVKALIKQAQQAEREYQNVRAIELYKQALSMIPDPIEDSVYATQICSTIGELNFLENHFEEAFEFYSQAVRGKDGLGSPTIHFRLGQLRYERGEMDRARDEFMRAYMARGMRAFEREDGKYYELIKDVVEKDHS